MTRSKHKANRKCPFTASTALPKFTAAQDCEWCEEGFNAHACGVSSRRHCREREEDAGAAQIRGTHQSVTVAGSIKFSRGRDTAEKRALEVALAKAQKQAKEMPVARQIEVKGWNQFNLSAIVASSGALRAAGAIGGAMQSVIGGRVKLPSAEVPPSSQARGPSRNRFAAFSQDVEGIPAPSRQRVLTLSLVSWWCDPAEGSLSGGTLQSQMTLLPWTATMRDWHG